MLRIEIEMFSGRPNPVWIITDEAETKRFLAAVAEAEGATAKQGAGFTGLGFLGDEPRTDGDTSGLQSLWFSDYAEDPLGHTYL